MYLRFYVDKYDKNHKMMKFVNDYTGDICIKINDQKCKTYTRTQSPINEDYWIDITQQWIKDIELKRYKE